MGTHKSDTLSHSFTSRWWNNFRVVLYLFFFSYWFAIEILRNNLIVIVLNCKALGSYSFDLNDTVLYNPLAKKLAY